MTRSGWSPGWKKGNKLKQGCFPLSFFSWRFGLLLRRHPDGRPLGEAFTEPDETCPTNPKSLRGPWFVCSQEGQTVQERPKVLTFE